jgi:hypothetical protein
MRYMDDRSPTKEGISEELHMSRLMVKAVSEDYFG